MSIGLTPASTWPVLMRGPYLALLPPVTSPDKGEEDGNTRIPQSTKGDCQRFEAHRAPFQAYLSRKGYVYVVSPRTDIQWMPL
jgi:hypothetical protein